MDLNFAARVIFSLAAIASAATGAPAQNTCVTAERIATLLNGINGSTGQQANPELRIQILSMKDALAAQNAQAVAARKSGREPDVKVIGKPADEANPPAEKPADRICRILEADPWPGKSVVDAEAASAWIRLIKTYLTGDQQRALLPVIVAGVERGEVPKTQTSPPSSTGFACVSRRRSCSARRSRSRTVSWSFTRCSPNRTSTRGEANTGCSRWTTTSVRSKTFTTSS